MTIENRRSGDCRLEQELTSLRLDVARLQERLMASDEALKLARSSLEHNQAIANEWRQENVDQRALYMTIDKTNALISIEASLRGALEGRVRVLEDTSKTDTGKDKAFNITWVVVASIITLGISAITLVFKFLGGH